MKLSKIALAVAALAIGSAALAAPNGARIGYSTGASATKGNLKIALTALCEKLADNVTASGAFLTEYASGSNVSTYTCNTTPALSSAAYGGAADSTFKNFRVFCIFWI